MTEDSEQTIVEPDWKPPAILKWSILKRMISLGSKTEKNIPFKEPLSKWTVSSEQRRGVTLLSIQASALDEVWMRGDQWM